MSVAILLPSISSFKTYSLSVTDEALIAETMVWPNFFRMNVFFALKGSKSFIIICLNLALRLNTFRGIRKTRNKNWYKDFISFP